MLPLFEEEEVVEVLVVEGREEGEEGGCPPPPQRLCCCCKAVREDLRKATVQGRQMSALQQAVTKVLLKW